MHSIPVMPGGLLTDDYRRVLDTIDSLRFKGVGKYIDLPQIIVCGDQSSGKSSVLEAISGISFPTKDALCTRFATELILRRNPQTSAKISFIPGPDRTESERDNLLSFERSIDNLDLAQVIHDAEERMGLNKPTKVFSRDVLRVEVTSPDQPHLTLVDLPGLFLAGNRTQSVEDSKIVQDLVLEYMSQPRSIILAVVSAKSEFALQQVTQRARELDPAGERTIGLITKPDTLDEGSDSQQAYVQLAQNMDVKFQHGWHIVRNRDFKSRKSTKADRDKAEEEFFASGIWSSLDADQLGICALIGKLSKILHDHNVAQLPQVLVEVENGIENCSQQLQKLGGFRDTISEQRRYLLRLSERFAGLVKAAVEGDYSNRSFFGEFQADEGYERRLRALIQNGLTDFAKDMSKKGHAFTIVDNPEEVSSKARPKRVKRSEYVSDVSSMMHKNRGRELPGTFNPLIVRELFASQCQPWKELANRCIRLVMNAVHSFLREAMKYITDDVTANRLLQGVIAPALSTLKASITQKLEELLCPHLNGHPITYNDYLAENIQAAQMTRHKRKLAEAFHPHTKQGQGAYVNNFTDLFSKVSAATEPNMDEYASMTAVDTMEAYYKVAMKKFTDDVSVLAIEQCIVDKIPSILSTDVICDMSDEKIKDLASESPESAKTRKALAEKIRALEEGLDFLGRLSKSRA